MRLARRVRVRWLRTCPAMAAAVVLAFLAFASVPAFSQPAPPAASLNDFVIEWIQGNYATPLVCTFGGQPRRGLRRVLIEPRAREGRHREATVRFVDLEAQEASRCFTELSGVAPNITGALVVRHPIIRVRPTALRDFKSELKRKRGFELDIVTGTLDVTAVGSDAAPESRPLRGGKLRIHILRQGDDGLRVLQDLPSPRKVRLEIESREGEVISFPASLARPDAPRRPGAR